MSKIKRKGFLQVLKDIRFLIGLFIFIFVGAVTFVVWIKNVNAEVKKQTEKAVKIEHIIEQQQKILSKQQALSEKIHDEFNLLLQLYLKLDDETLDWIQTLPKEVPVDSLGNPIFGREWLNLYAYDSVKVAGTDSIKYGFPKVGEVVTLVDTGKVVVRVLWDLR